MVELREEVGCGLVYTSVSDGPVYAQSWFFLSSRRRHTSSTRDWSSDVCSSDLEPAGDFSGTTPGRGVFEVDPATKAVTRGLVTGTGYVPSGVAVTATKIWLGDGGAKPQRSEERRVGKERWSWTAPSEHRTTNHS